MPSKVPTTMTNGYSSGTDIVISGMSGRLPECDNLREFQEKLYGGVDLVTDDDRRWPVGLYGLPSRTGKLKGLHCFDASFFGVHAKQADVMDPQLRMLLELTHEAMLDAGFNPQEFRGTKTGVFVGVSDSETGDYWSSDPDLVTGYGLTGCCRAMFPNRISYTFDLTGPSYAVDTACSSSSFAFYNAVTAIENGICDAAVVGGVNLTIKPCRSLEFHRLGMLSKDGKCKSFDSSGDGYVRAEACVVVLLQKRKFARRAYATVLAATVNTDGHKELGITFPSGDMQNRLMRETYLDKKINPLLVNYVEAHGTGTKAGDPQELNSIADIFCNNRSTALLIGSVKSNMGHAEPASGLCALVKVLFAMECGHIAPNLHFQEPNPAIPALIDGRLKVITGKPHILSDDGYVALNSFGFGGANAHIILKPNSKRKITTLQSTTCATSLPKIVAVSGRTNEAVNHLLNYVETHRHDEELIALVHEIHKIPIVGHQHRGYILLQGDNSSHEVVELQSLDERPVWFVFTGMGSQWPSMAKDMIQLFHIIPSLRMSLKTIVSCLEPFNIDLEHILTQSTDETFDDIRNSFVAIAAIQIMLVDILKILGITPAGIIGHSVGEIGCAYADETLTAEQAILAAFSRGQAILDSKLPYGAMAATGMSWEMAKQKCPPGVFPACNNSPTSVTVSGPENELNKFIEQLKEENIFAKKVKSSNTAFHSKYIAAAGPKLLNALQKIIPNPKKRSSKWISTSIPKNDWHSALAQYSSAEYHVNNLLSPVLFYEAIQHVPSNAIVIEIAPTGLLQAILKRVFPPTVDNVPLMSYQAANNMHFFLEALGRLYNSGIHPQIQFLYPQCSWPVSKGTPMISSEILWDHNTEWTVVNLANRSSSSGEVIVKFDLNTSDGYLAGHTIDGRILFPATGYLTMVWQVFSKLHGKNYEELPVVIQNVRFERATILSFDKPVQFMINLCKGTGSFVVFESDAPVVRGSIFLKENHIEFAFTHEVRQLISQTDIKDLSKLDIYKELRLRGYEYKDVFQGIINADMNLTHGNLRWDKNWVTFMDTMLQFTVLQKDTRELYLPTGIERIVIDPKMHLQVVDEYDNEIGVPVFHQQNVGIIRSGGIEIRRLKASLAHRRLQPQIGLKLESYDFVPYIDHIVQDSDDTLKNLENSLRILLQILLENSGSITKLKIIELVLDPQAVKSNSALIIKTILEQEPAVVTEIRVLSKKLLSDSASLEVQKIQNIVSSTLEGLTDAHLIAIKDPTLAVDIKFHAIKTGTFFLFECQIGSVCEEFMQHYNIDMISNHSVNNKQLILGRVSAKSNIIEHNYYINIKPNDLSWVEEIKVAMETCERKPSSSRIFLYSIGNALNGIVGLTNCLRREPGGEFIRCFFIIDHTDNALTFSHKYKAQIEKDLVHNVLKNKRWGSFRHSVLDTEMKSRKLNVKHAYINTLVRGDLSSLSWIEGPLSFHRSSNSTEVLCYVDYAPLNFRDIMLATGKLPPDALPGNLAGQDCILGLEFAGRDTKGRRVMGMVEAKSLATTVLANNTFLWDVPEKWSMEEAATVPVAYGTSYYALIVRGKLKPGESVLIHAGSGGVGQAAIAIALHMGCSVFTTVSNQRKRDFLKERYPILNDNHIGNSRDTTFEQLIMRETNGKGVNVVLNSLAGDLMQASVRCLALNGRFLEIGKADLSNDSPLPMSVFLKNVTFHGVLLDALFDATDSSNKMDQEEVVRLLKDGIKNGAVRPLPITVFKNNEVEEAFRYMATGKHIGKVLIEVKNTSCTSGSNVVAIPKTYMDPQKSYILIGGLGGFGLELARWLIIRGARKLILTSRSGIKTGYQAYCIRRFQKKGVEIIISNDNVVHKKGVLELFSKATKLGHIGGIFNLAAVLSDALMQNQNAETFRKVFEPKVDGSFYLHEAANKLNPGVDYFVNFSSVSCGRGNAGQSNYGYANSFMERLAEDRQMAGLPAVTIQWGAIGDVGLIVEMMGDTNTEIGGTIPQRISSCLSTLDMFLQQPNPVVASMVLANKDSSTQRGASNVSLIDAVLNILGVKNSQNISQSTTLSEMGMDSLMGTEIKQTLERTYDIVLSAQEIRSLTFSKLESLQSGDSTTVMQNTLQVEARDTNQGKLVPEQCVLPIKQHKNNVTVFVLHPIEGVVYALKHLMNHIKADVYGLQCSPDVPRMSIQDMADYYVKKVQLLQKKGPYFFVGYSFGAAVAFEMAILLEAQGHIAILVLIDGAPDFLVGHIEHAKHSQSIVETESIRQSEALYYFITQFDDSADKKKVVNELSVLPSLEMRLATVAKVLQSDTYTSNEILLAAELFYYKLLACENYKPSAQFHGKVHLIKAMDNYVDIGEDYGLSKICTSTVTIASLKGNHKTILEGSSAEKIAEIINNNLPLRS